MCNTRVTKQSCTSRLPFWRPICLQTKSTNVTIIRHRLIDKAFQLDLYKGAPGSYRTWSRQLRQPIPLASHNAVITLAPIAGFEHRFNVLDTLGFDAKEMARSQREQNEQATKKS